MGNDARVNGLVLTNTELLKGVGASIEATGAHKRMADAARRAERDAKNEVDRLSSDYDSLLDDYVREKKAKEAAQAALAMKEELLLEWMHSNEAFKRLARKYGKKLGVSDEQRQSDLDDCVLEVAEEKPEFAATKATKTVKQERGIK